MSLGTNISRLRAEHHLSQGDLAEALTVSRQSVSKWETDSSVPDLDKLVKLSQVFDVTLDELVMGAEPQPKAETPPQQVVVSHRMPGRKIAGTILFCMGFLAFLIPTVLGGFLTGVILAVPFLVCGIICFLAQKRPGLWCAWAVYLLAYIICYYGTGLSWTYIFFTFSWEHLGYARLYHRRLDPGTGDTGAADRDGALLPDVLFPDRPAERDHSGPGVELLSGEPAIDVAHRPSDPGAGRLCGLQRVADGAGLHRPGHRLHDPAVHRPDAVGADVRRLEGLPPLGSFWFCTTTPRHRPGRFS